MAKCRICNRTGNNVAGTLELCRSCILEHPHEAINISNEAHARSRIPYHLPISMPKEPNGLQCNICTNECRIPNTKLGYCGVQENHGGHFRGISSFEAKFFKSLEPIPGNCTAGWICPGGSNSGFPDYSHSEGPETGYRALRVFYHTCSFNCLFCKSWHFRDETLKRLSFSRKELLSKVKEKTACISFHGGDPGPYAEFSLKTAQMVRKKRDGKILRICWEINGAMSRKYLDQVIDLSMESGGVIKYDLKALDENLHIALTGVSNSPTLENFQILGSRFDERGDVPVCVASTPMIPGYVEAEEIRKIAGFIASVNPNIPYTLLAFKPEHYMKDLPPTSRELAIKCLDSAKEAGLTKVRVDKSLEL